MKLQWSFTQRLNSFRIQNQTGNLFLELIHWSEIKLKHSGHAFQVFPPTGVCFLLPELSSIQRYIPVSSYRRLLYGSDDADKSLRSGTSEGYDSLQFVQRVLSWPRPNYITSGWRSSSTICITRICTDAVSFNQSLRTNTESPTRCTSFLSVQFRSSCQGRHLELL